MTKNNDVLDAFKFIAALSVVGIHTFPSKSILGSDLKILARFSVPFFFIVSGYFLFKKISFREKEKDKKILFNYIKRILKVYLSWLIFYIPFFIVSIMNFVKGEMDLRGNIIYTEHIIRLCPQNRCFLVFNRISNECIYYLLHPKLFW